MEERKIKLNIGCGNKILKGFVNLDNFKLKGVSIVHDLNKYPYPFCNKSISLILADNVLEHLDSKTEPMKEFYRILKDDGILEVYVPYAPSVGAFSDPTHKQFFSIYSYDHYNPSNNLGFYVTPKFETLEIKLYLYSFLKPLEWLINKSRRLQVSYCYTLAGLFPPTQIYFKLKKVNK